MEDNNTPIIPDITDVSGFVDDNDVQTGTDMSDNIPDGNKPIVPDIKDMSGFVGDTDPAIIQVIGVGGGGGNAVNYMYRQKIPMVKFVVCNTDKQHLDLSPVPSKLLIGYDLTRGLGAGNDPTVGRQCAELDEEKIRELFKPPIEMVFITAGMGGGTGTGAAPVVARLAREADMLTIGIVTVPFMFEGQKKVLKALDGANEMKKYVDALLIINNENLIDLYKDLNFFNAFGKADDTLANAARSISEIISEKCYINVDFRDVKSTLKDSGTAIISTAIGEGENRISNAIHNALHSPLLKTHDINTSKRLLFKFSCSSNSDNPIRAEEINEITMFTSKLSSNIDVKWGIADNPTMGDKVKVTVLASGFDVTIQEMRKDGDGSGSAESPGEVIRFPGQSDEVDREKERVKEENLRDAAKIYGEDKMRQQRRNAARMKYAVLKPYQFDDHEVISLLEKTPAYNRSSRFNDELKRISEQSQQSNFPDNKKEEPSGNTISFGDD